jgi:hypothetical protein
MPFVDEPQPPVEPVDDDAEDKDEPVESTTVPALPTDALPGTSGKIAILRRRVDRGELLWHPGDMTFERLGETISENLKSFFPA